MNALRKPIVKGLGLPTGVIKIQLIDNNNRGWLSKCIFEAHLLSMTIRIRSRVLLYIPFSRKAINCCSTLKLKYVVLIGTNGKKKTWGNCWKEIVGSRRKSESARGAERNQRTRLCFSQPHVNSLYLSANKGTVLMSKSTGSWSTNKSYKYRVTECKYPRW